MRNVTITGFSIPKDLLRRIEIERGDISRSKFLSKLVEQALESDSLKKLPQGSHKVGAPRDSCDSQVKTTRCYKE